MELILASKTEYQEAKKITNEWWDKGGKVMWADAGTFAVRSAIIEFILNQMGLTGHKCREGEKYE